MCKHHRAKRTLFCRPHAYCRCTCRTSLRLVQSSCPSDLRHFTDTLSSTSRRSDRLLFFSYFSIPLANSIAALTQYSSNGHFEWAFCKQYTTNNPPLTLFRFSTFRSFHSPVSLLPLPAVLTFFVLSLSVQRGHASTSHRASLHSR